MLDSRADLPQEQAADYKTYAVSGTHWEIGHWQGSRFATFGPTPAEMHPEHVAFARACVAEARHCYPPLVEELNGYADGAGRRPADLVWHYCLQAGAPEQACSSVGVLTADGPVIARNYDYFYFENRRHLVTARPDGALAHTGMWEGLIAGRFDGVNAAGVWVSIHGGGGRPARELQPGLAFHHICRLLLETCRSAREAAQRCAALPHIASYNYFIADAREMFVVEAHPERARIREAVDGILACTNHPEHPEMVDLDACYIGENSRARLAYLRDAATGARTAADPGQALQAAMRDHSVPVCGHTDGLATFWSALCIPAHKHLAYSLGAPCRNAYVLAEWPD